MPKFLDRLSHAWNAFSGTEDYTNPNMGVASSIRPDRPRIRYSSEKSILTTIFTRIAIDVAANKIVHIRKDDQGRFVSEINSGLNNCLTVEANIDQSGTQFLMDCVISLFDEGVIAIVPTDTTDDPEFTGSYDVLTLRVGRIVQWYPRHVRVSLYNERTGLHKEIRLPKSSVAIVENPLYLVMNEPNSTLKRLIRKLALLDSMEEAAGSGKLDVIIQLPYVVKSDLRKNQAEQRAKDIETQLKGSTYGIAYIDGTERITQLNRPVENNLLAHVTYLTDQLYGQLGLTKEVIDGTASEEVMVNYYNQTVGPVTKAIVESMRRTFLTKTARSQGQDVATFRDIFRSITAASFAELGDKLSRNEIMSSNELRAVIGLPPDKDPKSDLLVNSNLNQPQLDAGGSGPLQLEPETSDKDPEYLVKDDTDEA